ncbi:uncharacterized protein LOC136061819 [Quercus suber]|uniref:uncharacterized protein LOC136061819 n=1 Tax=Quercus suber TaxID=58331 RepID=UPI0032DEC7A7
MHRALLEFVGASGSVGPEAVCFCKKECGFMDGKSWFQDSICNSRNIPCFNCPFNILLVSFGSILNWEVKHLLKCNYPGAYIGPEPTTHRFIVVMTLSADLTSSKEGFLNRVLGHGILHR